MDLCYRFQLLKTVTITPEVQFLFDPALNPDADVITVWRMRITTVF
ncbi:uncharacterized protein Dvar_77300 [Desulfosarcina variabilis str. Montpellier]